MFAIYVTKTYGSAIGCVLGYKDEFIINIRAKFVNPLFKILCTCQLRWLVEPGIAVN